MSSILSISLECTWREKKLEYYGTIIISIEGFFFVVVH